MEPPRSGVPDRPRPAPLSTEPRGPRLRVRVRPPDTPPTPPEEPQPESELALRPPARLPVPRAALLAAAFVLALTSRGDVVLLAVLLGFGAARRTSALACAAALSAALVRWGSPGLGAIAGAQAVVGPAGWTGSNVAVASSWLAASALLLAAVPLDDERLAVRALSVAPFAVAAADVVVGPAPGGALALRAAATVLACGLAFALTRWRRWPWLAVGVGVLALVTAGVSR